MQIYERKEKEDIDVQKNNAYRFKSFSERIKNIRVDVFHDIHKSQSFEKKDIDDNSTYFTTSIEDWSTLHLDVFIFNS
jgi:hypothetical protein